MLEGLLQGWWAGQNQRSANDWSEYAMQRRHQWEAADLKAAGLNPILSAGGTPGGISGAPPAPVPDLTNAVSSAWQRKQMDAQIEATKAEAESKYNLADWYKEQTAKTRLEQDNVSTDNYLKMRQAQHYDYMNPEVASRIPLNEAETSWKVADVKRIPFSIEGLKASAGRDRSQQLLNFGSVANSAKQLEILREELTKFQSENVGRKLDADFYQTETGKLSRFLDRMQTLFGVLGSAREADRRESAGSGVKRK